MALHRADQKRIFKLKPASECLNLVSDKTSPLGIELIPTECILGRVISKNIFSNVIIPSTHTAAMDGYAIDSNASLKATSDNPVTLQIIHKIFPESMKSLKL